jgi:hypothetical protein
MSGRELALLAARRLRLILAVVCGLLLAGTGGLVVAEAGWLRPATLTAEEAFNRGSTGTEAMPLAVFQVLPDLFPDQFQPAGPAAGDWVAQFGFTPGKPEVNQGLPLGFALSYHRPRTGAPSPVPFVGFTCGLCHTALLQRVESDPGVVIEGMGSTSVDFIAWVDAFKTAILDEQRLTLPAVDGAYRRRFGRPLTTAESLVSRLWLRDLRDRLRDNLPRFDAPYGGADLRSAELMPNGPSRTQPFRNLVRNIMDRPATLGDHGYCKIPSVFEQRNRVWGQFDGSVGNRLTRSVLAALAVGATRENLILPDISKSVADAIDYTTTLRAPRYAAVFPAEAGRLDPHQVERGRTVYRTHCRDCHGAPDGPSGSWVAGPRTGVVVPATDLGTDPERVRFRYYQELPDLLVAHFPAGHPLRPDRALLRPGPAGRVAGYINAPLEAVWARAPYLHNGSVLTLAELVNLRPRRKVFFRGRNLYDPDDAGLVSPAAANARTYFRFDTAVRGNSSAGHDYPWPYRGPGWDEQALRDLLAYLKTIP